MKNSEIASLINKFKEGDKAAFDAIYEELWEELFYSAKKRLNNKEDAMDAIQDTMIEVCKSIHTLKNDMAFIAWVNQILVYRCAHINRKSPKVEFVDFEIVEDDLQEEYSEFLPEEALMTKEISEEIAEIVSALPEEQKNIILLYYFNRFSTEEIAEIMGSTQNAVRLKLSRARKKIGDKVKILQQKGVIMYSSALPIPVLTRILMQEMETVCTPEIKEKIYEGIEAYFVSGGLIAGVLVNGGGIAGETTAASAGAIAATTGSTTAVSASTVLAIKISASVIAITILGGGATLYMKSSNNPDDITPISPPMAISSQAVIPNIMPTSTALEIEETVTQEDIEIVRSWIIPSNENKNAELMVIVNKYGFETQNVYVNINNHNEMYILFTKETEDKRYLICEFYDPMDDIWSAVYKIDSLDTPVPDSENLKVWFYEVQEILLNQP